jgi:hypothetical protein
MQFYLFHETAEDVLDHVIFISCIIQSRVRQALKDNEMKSKLAADATPLPQASCLLWDKLLTRACYFVLPAKSGHRFDTGHNSTARLAGIAWPLGSAFGNRPTGVQEDVGRVSLHN